MLKMRMVAFWKTIAACAATINIVEASLEGVTTRSTPMPTTNGSTTTSSAPTTTTSAPMTTTAGTVELVCDATYTLNANDDFCYRYDSTLIKTYDEARKYCVDDGGDLVSIHNAFTNAFVGKYNPNGILTGLQYTDEVGNYSWSDGSVVDYQNYVDGYWDWKDYVGYCIKLVKSKWDNFDCKKPLQFVCRKNAWKPGASKKCPNSTAIYTAPGTLLSPGYPENYDLSDEPNDCMYKLASKYGMKTKITFEEVNLTKNEGWIYVYETWDEEFELAQVNNHFNGQSIFINSNLIRLKLFGSPEGRWKIKFFPEETDITVTGNSECPDPNLVYVEEGVLQSPGYPDYFSFPGTAALCEYKIAVKEDQNIRLFFDEVLTKDSSGYYYVHKKWTAAATDEPDFKFNMANQGTSKVIESTHIKITINVAAGRFKIRFDAVEPEYSKMMVNV